VVGALSDKQLAEWDGRGTEEALIAPQAGQRKKAAAVSSEPTAAVSAVPSTDDGANRLEVTEAEVEQFRRDGFLLVKGLLDRDEAELLREITAASPEVHADPTALRQLSLNTGALPARTITQDDGEGSATRFYVDDCLRDDFFSAIARCERVVGNMERLLGAGELSHWHHKIMLKHGSISAAGEPQTPGGGFEFKWHPDFGYWHETGKVLFPRMGSCMIAVTPTTKANGCLQVLRGSPEIGLLAHERGASVQKSAEQQRVDAALACLAHEYVEMDSGDALFFHANLLHKSDQNAAADPRWSLIGCYNARNDQPFEDNVHHPGFSAILRLPDAELRALGRRQLHEMTAIAARL
jgi:ectoine hydroxylase-related dioxygenase (phytanoyl-CoA dioxygenase family)